jgi:hypothetical protein
MHEGDADARKPGCSCRGSLEETIEDSNADWEVADNPTTQLLGVSFRGYMERATERDNKERLIK